MSTKNCNPICRECGKHNIVFDSTAHWSRSTASFELNDVMDKGHYCVDCESECLVDWVEPDQATSRTFTVTLDVIGRYKVHVNAPNHDQAVDDAINAMDKGKADILWCDDQIEAVDVVDTAQKTLV